MNTKILVADDDCDNRVIIRHVLEAAGYQVVEAVNGLEAIEMALSQKPALILMDLSMPKLNGWEAARRIKQTPDLAGIPIFAFTANALTGDELKAKAAGCDDYISKPCVPREVVKKIKDRLEKPDAR
jgi:two-component system cell cycle response regulator DivK